MWLKLWLGCFRQLCRRNLTTSSAVEDRISLTPSTQSEPALPHHNRIVSKMVVYYQIAGQKVGSHVVCTALNCARAPLVESDIATATSDNEC